MTLVPIPVELLQVVDVLRKLRALGASTYNSVSIDRLWSLQYCCVAL